MKSLAIKYRPKTFDDVVEQDNIKIILTQQLKTGTFKNSYLFTGGAGTGKTTCARIFANEINKGQGNPIELDAASNNGVDNVRDIIQQAQLQSLDSEFKVFIIDECFYKDTEIQLCDGTTKRIVDIQVGDYVNNLVGGGYVKNVFKNLISLDRLCIIKLTDDTHMLTTIDHLFFTNSGWVEAKNLVSGDLLYEGTNVSSLWKTVSGKVSTENLLGTMSQKINIIDGAENDAVGIRNTAEIGILGENEKIKSDARPEKYREDGRNENIYRNASSAVQSENGEWEIYCSADDALSDTDGRVDFRIRNSYKDATGKWIPNLLQSRPRITKEKVGDRGGWEKPQLEKWFIKRYEENYFTERIRVESVTLYERGNNEQYFGCYLTDTERDTGFITLYDLEVSGNSSYFANGILVHNCHMITNAGWNAMLKLIEEPPAKSIFIFCTTNPEKIPKTILSRVQRYDFRRISQNGIIERLCEILKQEDIQTFDAESTEYIAKLADGGMRDAITLLDKSLSYSAQLTLDNVVKALGTVNYDTMIKLTEAIYYYDAEKSVKILNDVYDEGKDLKQFVKDYLVFLIDVVKYGRGCDFKYLTIPKIYAYEKFLDELGGAEYDVIDKLLDDWVKLNANIKYSSIPKADIEVVLVKYGDLRR